ncbi:unnamed protein product, partial [Allacma fusca]
YQKLVSKLKDGDCGQISKKGRDMNLHTMALAQDPRAWSQQAGSENIANKTGFMSIWCGICQGKGIISHY